jgi:hypothetical protein
LSQLDQITVSASCLTAEWVELQYTEGYIQTV